MVLNNSFDRLLSQVTEIDTQRRKENEERDKQARKIEQLENALAHQSRQIEMMESTSYHLGQKKRILLFNVHWAF